MESDPFDEFLNPFFCIQGDVPATDVEDFPGQFTLTGLDLECAYFLHLGRLVEDTARESGWTEEEILQGYRDEPPTEAI